MLKNRSVGNKRKESARMQCFIAFYQHAGHGVVGLRQGRQGRQREYTIWTPPPPPPHTHTHILPVSASSSEHGHTECHVNSSGEQGIVLPIGQDLVKEQSLTKHAKNEVMELDYLHYTPRVSVRCLCLQSE